MLGPVTLPPIPPLLSSASGLLPPGGMVRIRVTNVEKERVEKQTRRREDTRRYHLIRSKNEGREGIVKW